jgi:Cys-tRNA(Pro)/Cys-tRNA(Cys) deacylase
VKTPATALLDSRRVSYRLHSYPHQDGKAYGPEAAKALGVDPARVFKTLVAKVDGTLTVAVLPVAGTLDLKALAASVGAKRAKMAEVSAAERATTTSRAASPHSGSASGYRWYAETSASAFDTICRGGGRRGLEIELSPDDLISLNEARLAPIAVG